MRGRGGGYKALLHIHLVWSHVMLEAIIQTSRLALVSTVHIYKSLSLLIDNAACDKPTVVGSAF